MKLLLGAALALAAAAPAAATHITFGPDNQGYSDTFTRSGVTFSAERGPDSEDDATLFLGASPTGNGICSAQGEGDDAQCIGTLLLTFTQAASDLTFDAIGSDIRGDRVIKMVVTTDNGTFTSYGETTDADPTTAEHMNLTQYNNIWSVAITSIGASNYAFDNFDFRASGSGSGEGTDVPEPASWAMMVAGFGLVGSALRSHRHKLSLA